MLCINYSHSTISEGVIQKNIYRLAFSTWVVGGPFFGRKNRLRYSKHSARDWVTVNFYMQNSSLEISRQHCYSKITLLKLIKQRTVSDNRYIGIHSNTPDKRINSSSINFLLMLLTIEGFNLKRWNFTHKIVMSMQHVLFRDEMVVYN